MASESVWKKRYEHIKAVHAKHGPKASNMKGPGEAFAVGAIAERIEKGFADNMEIVQKHPYAKTLAYAAIGYKVAKKRPASGYALLGVSGYVGSATYRAQNPDSDAKGASRTDAGSSTDAGADMFGG